MKTTTNKFSSVRVNSNNLHTGDIDGASPKLHGSRVTNKPDMSNQNWDIDRSAPRALHMPLYKPDNILNVSDIEGARPQCVKFTTTRQSTDPLNPQYKLTQVETRPATPPRFIRDQMAHDDIEKSQPSKDRHASIKTRETMNITDIEGTRAKPRHQERKRSPGFDSFNYSDVTKTVKPSNRCSNPLNPVYEVQGEEWGKSETIGEVHGAKPARMPSPPNKNKQTNSLWTKDIQGAQTETRGLGVFANVSRRDGQRSTGLNTDDIEGAKVGTLLKGPKTTRTSNPLDNEDYQYPGRSELLDGNNPFSMTRTDQQREDKKKLRTGTL